MNISRLSTPKHFLEHVVDPDVSEFVRNSSDLRIAFHACNSLLSLRDWVFITYVGEKWLANGMVQQKITHTNVFLKDLISIHPSFGIVADIANASKHLKLDPDRKKTSMSESGDVEYQETHGGALGGGPIGAAPLGGVSGNIIVQTSNQTYHVKQCVSEVHTAWHGLFDENNW